MVSVGMEDQRIMDSQITASSIYHVQLSPWIGRLNLILEQGAWVPAVTTRGQFLQIDLLNITAIFKVATQGRAISKVQYVSSYSLQYSIDGTIWAVYKTNGVEKVSSNTKKYLLNESLGETPLY